jgi:hypothetical protein
MTLPLSSETTSPLAVDTDSNSLEKGLEMQNGAGILANGNTKAVSLREPPEGGTEA